MNIRTYDDSDLVITAYRGDESCKWEFVNDLPGDNPDLFGDKDNNEMAVKLEAIGAVPKGAKQDPESSCYYIYFSSKKQGSSFINTLNTYIAKKAQLVRDAEAF